MLENNTFYMLNTCSWQILPETLTSARSAAEKAAHEHMLTFGAVIAIQDAEVRGEVVDPVEKERVFRTRFDAMDKWVYLRNVYNELERSSQARLRIDEAMQKRRERDVVEAIRKSDEDLRRNMEFASQHGERVRATTTLDSRMLSEFAM